MSERGLAACAWGNEHEDDAEAAFIADLPVNVTNSKG